MKSNKMLENANKVSFIVHEFPEKNLTEVIGTLAMPAIEINTAIWLATELGFISKPDKDEQTVRFIKAPETWQFGAVVDDLQAMLMYAFNELAKKETDLEENYLSNWTAGYASHDILIAMRHLLSEKQLANYNLADGESIYSFFSLYENREKEWGKTQFKVAPESESKETEVETITTTTTLPGQTEMV